MSTFGEIDNGDRLGWQMNAAIALVEVLQLALKRDLPLVWWSANGAGGLQGKVPPGYGRFDEREVWRAWVDALDLQVGKSWTSGGVEHARATTRYRTKRGALTTITLSAEIPTPQMQATIAQDRAELDQELPPISPDEFPPELQDALRRMSKRGPVVDLGTGQRVAEGGRLTTYVGEFRESA